MPGDRCRTGRPRKGLSGESGLSFHIGRRGDEVSRFQAAQCLVTDVDVDAPERWAALRAQTGLQLPDVIVLDTALTYNARAIATFDTRLATSASLRGLEVLGRSA